MIKVLVLDDSNDYLRALRSALRSEFDVVTAQTVAAARDRLDETVQVALIDVRLSEADEDNRDGVAFLRWAKERYPTIPMLMMSAYRNFDAVVEALNMGADYFLKKPIDLRQLRELLREFGEKGLRPEHTDALRRQMESKAE
jgi:two-component system, NtrC family, response regulator AtoC